jgi:hypothetical protein
MPKIFLCLIFLSILIACQNDESFGENCEKSYNCDLIPDPGYCRAAIPRYYFDKKEGKCKEFIWGGCDGVVPFKTLEECKLCECALHSNE